MPYIDKVGIAGSQYDIKDTTGTFIAPKEISPATAAHAVGTYLVYDGTLYRVGPSAVAEGDTLTVGTNIEAVPDGIGGEVAELQSHFDDITVTVQSKNLYDIDACNPQNGYTYMPSGVPSENASYAISGKIPIEANTQYVFSAGTTRIRRAFFFGGQDGNTYLSRVDIASPTGPFTTPENATYVGMEMFAATHTDEQYAAAIAIAQLEKGNVATDFVPFSKTCMVPSNALVDRNAVEGAKNYTVIDSLVNHFDKSQCVDGKYFNSTNHAIYNHKNYGFSGLIPVKPNTQYNISCDKTLAVGKMATYYHEWDATKTFVQQTQQNYAFSYISQIQTGANTHYISINLLFDAAHTTAQFDALIDSIMLVEGMQIPPEYVAYNPEPVVDHTKFNNAYQLNADKWRGKKWLVCGTSISYQDSHVFTEGVREGEVCRGYIGNVSRNKPMLITNEGISGSTLALASQDSALINRYQSLNFGNYDFISLEYGVNDFGNNVPVGTASDTAGTGTFAACLKTIIEYTLAQNPIIGLIICTEPDVRGATTNSNGNTLKDFADVTIEIARQYRLPICDWYYGSGINALNKGDGTREDTMTQAGTHPSNYGHMRMGAMLNQVFDSMLC